MLILLDNQNNVYIQGNIHQNSNDILPQVKKNSINPKVDMDVHKTQIAKEILSKNSKTGGITS
jgi:hypothetical protein